MYVCDGIACGAIVHVANCYCNCCYRVFVVYRVSDAGGKLQTSVVEEGAVHRSSLDSADGTNLCSTMYRLLLCSLCYCCSVSVLQLSLSTPVKNVLSGLEVEPAKMKSRMPYPLLMSVSLL